MCYGKPLREEPGTAILTIDETAFYRLPEKVQAAIRMIRIADVRLCDGIIQIQVAAVMIDSLEAMMVAERSDGGAR